MDIEVLKKRVTPELERNILDWKNKPESHFTGFNEQPLEWGSRVIGNAVMFGLTDSHGMIFMPNISCDYKVKKERYTLGWVEGISMYGGGIAIVQHFALNEKITGMGLGTALFGAIARFLKSHNAIAIEFRENHSSKIEHYRSFFGKLNVPEVKRGVWRFELYPYHEVPEKVRMFHETLKNPNKHQW
ncbi:hypothetical protein ACKN8R_25720 (plasmid) [Vibrio parahaemolyticus]|uniref:hypothetical protein n=1 Tax=Vibrio parahaemolyticus TaxID=670 RepID=UPI0038F74266